MKSLKIFIYLKICFMTAVSILYFNTLYAVTPPIVEDTVLQNLINNAPSGSTLHLPRGEFYLGRPLEIPADKNLSLEGFATKIRVHPNFFLADRSSTNQALINVRGGNFKISKVGLIGTSGISIATCGIKLYGGDSIEISDANFQSFNKTDSAVICGVVGKKFKFLHSLTSNVYRSLDLTGPNQEISIIGGSINGPGGLRLAGKIIVSDIDFEGRAGNQAPVISVITPIGQPPSELKFERNYMELKPPVCDLTNFPQVVAIDIDGKGVIRDNQMHLNKVVSRNPLVACSGLEGILVKIRSPNLPLSLSGNNAQASWNKVYWWDPDYASSPKISETSNNWNKPGGALYPVGSGYSSFGSKGMRLNQQTGLKTLLKNFPVGSISLQLELTDSTVFEIETTELNQSVSVSRPPANLTTALTQKNWRIIHRIPGSIVVILNASSSTKELLLDREDFKAGQALMPGKSRMFVVDQLGRLNPVGR